MITKAKVFKHKHLLEHALEMLDIEGIELKNLIRFRAQRIAIQLSVNAHLLQLLQLCTAC